MPGVKLNQHNRLEEKAPRGELGSEFITIPNGRTAPGRCPFRHSSEEHSRSRNADSVAEIIIAEVAETEVPAGSDRKCTYALVTAHVQLPGAPPTASTGRPASYPELQRVAPRPAAPRRLYPNPPHSTHPAPLPGSLKPAITAIAAPSLF